MKDKLQLALLTLAFAASAYAYMLLMDDAGVPMVIMFVYLYGVFGAYRDWCRND